MLDVYTHCKLCQHKFDIVSYQQICGACYRKKHPERECSGKCGTEVKEGDEYCNRCHEEVEALWPEKLKKPIPGTISIDSNNRISFEPIIYKRTPGPDEDTDPSYIPTDVIDNPTGESNMITHEQLITKVAAIQADMLEVLRAKSNDYASEEDALSNFKSAEKIGLTAMQGLVMRLTDKMSRVHTFCKDGKLQVKNESVVDAFRDIIGYASIAMVMLEEEECENQMRDNESMRSKIPESWTEHPFSKGDLVMVSDPRDVNRDLLGTVHRVNGWADLPYEVEIGGVEGLHHYSDDQLILKSAK